MALSILEKRELFEEFKKELMEAQKVYVEVCRDGIKLPQYANIGDAGMDVRAAEEITILPGETKIVPIGLKMAIPQGYELQVRPRSGLSLKSPLRIANTPGTIDSGYRDEIGIIIHNDSRPMFKTFRIDMDLHYSPEVSREITDYATYFIDEKGNKSGIYQIKFGDRIAQVVLARFETIEFVSVEDVKTLGLNRGGGFGHTGTK